VNSLSSRECPPSWADLQALLGPSEGAVQDFSTCVKAQVGLVHDPRVFLAFAEAAESMS